MLGLPASHRRAARLAQALSSPVQNLLGGIVFVGIVMAVSTVGYMMNGWSLGDAVYMVILTVYTVGYDEVRPIDTTPLRFVTGGLIVFGCTGMIFVTGALIQFITATQFTELLDHRRTRMRIEELRQHIIICGYGRIGSMLARELAAASRPFVVLERSETRSQEAHADGHLCLTAEATDESALLRAGVQRASAVVTVLPEDAANVFITLSARSLNPTLTIIARGEAPSTERKLIQAGADRVVLPAHIGAERMADYLLYPELGEAALGGTALRRLGLVCEVIVVEAGSPWEGQAVEAIEQQADETFVIVEIERRPDGRRERVARTTRVLAGDGVMVVGRSTAAAVAGFANPAR